MEIFCDCQCQVSKLRQNCTQIVTIMQSFCFLFFLFLHTIRSPLKQANCFLIVFLFPHHSRVVFVINNILFYIINHCLHGRRLCSILIPFKIFMKRELLIGTEVGTLTPMVPLLKSFKSFWRIFYILISIITLKKRCHGCQGATHRSTVNNL